MQNLIIKKLQRVENTDKQLLKKGIVAFQMVNITVNYFGKVLQDTYDTKIMKDGKQFVISGDGFIKDGFEIN
jgi:hypothetical protein